MDILNSKTATFQSQSFSAERHNIECYCKKNFEFTISHIISMYLSGELLSHFLPGDEHIIEGIKPKLDKLSSIPHDKLYLLSESIDQVILSFCAKLHQIPQTEILSKVSRIKHSKFSHSMGTYKCESSSMVRDIPIKPFGEKQEVSIHTENLGQMIEEEQAKGLPVLFILTRYFGNNEDQYIAWNLNEESSQVNKYPLPKRVEPYSELRYKQSAQELKLLNNFDNLFLYLRRAYTELCEIAGKNELEEPNEEESMEKILIGILIKIEKLKHIHKIIRKKCSIFKERLHEKDFNIGFKEGGSEKTSKEYKRTEIIWDIEKDSKDFCEKSTQIPDLENLSGSIATQENKESKEAINSLQESSIIAHECKKDDNSIKTNIKTKVFDAQIKPMKTEPDADNPNSKTIKQNEIQTDKSVFPAEESEKIDINEQGNEKDRKMNINIKSFSSRLARGSENEAENLSLDINTDKINEKIEEGEKTAAKSFVDKEEDKKHKEIKSDSEKAKINSSQSENYQAGEIDVPIDESKVSEIFVDKEGGDKSEIIKSGLEETESKPLDSIKNQAGEIDIHIGKLSTILEEDKSQNLVKNVSKEKETKSELQESSENQNSLYFATANAVKVDKTSFEPENTKIKDLKSINEAGDEKEVFKADEKLAIVDCSQILETDEKNKNLNYQIKKTVTVKSSSITEDSEYHDSSLLTNDQSDLWQNVSSMTTGIIEKSNPTITDLQLSLDQQTNLSEIKEEEKNEDLEENNEISCRSEDKEKSIGITIKKNSTVKVKLEDGKEDTKFEKLLSDENLEENKENDLDKQREIKMKLSKFKKEINKTKKEKSQLFDEEDRLIEESPTIYEVINQADKMPNPKKDLIENDNPESEENVGSDKSDHLRKIQTLLTKRTQQISRSKIENSTPELSDQNEEEPSSNTPEENKSIEPFDALRELKTQLTKNVKQVISKKKMMPKNSSTTEGKEVRSTPNEISQGDIKIELPLNEAANDLQSEIVDESGKKRKLTTKLQKKTKLVLKKMKAINTFGNKDKSDPPTPYEVDKAASLSSLREVKTPSPLLEDTELSFPERSEGKRRTQL